MSAESVQLANLVTNSRLEVQLASESALLYARLGSAQK